MGCKVEQEYGLRRAFKYPRRHSFDVLPNSIVETSMLQRKVSYFLLCCRKAYMLEFGKHTGVMEMVRVPSSTQDG